MQLGFECGFHSKSEWLLCIQFVRAGGFVSLEVRNLGLFPRWLLMPWSAGVPLEEFNLKQKQSVYNPLSSKPGTSQPLVKNGRVLWSWLLLKERKFWGTCINSSDMWAVGCYRVVQIWEYFLKESMWPMLALEPVCSTQHLCLVCTFMLKYSLTFLKELILDRNFHYAAPDFLFCQT